MLYAETAEEEEEEGFELTIEIMHSYARYDRGVEFHDRHS
jgi:hypothetical protein